jgi:M penetrans paralogue family 26
MENQQQPPAGWQTQMQMPGGGQRPLPNATAALVLGILSIVLCWLYGIIGLGCGIIGLILANKDTKMYNANPGVYTQSSYNNAKAGKVCSIIGLALSALFVIYMIVVFMTIGSFMLNNREIFR